MYEIQEGIHHHLKYYIYNMNYKYKVGNLFFALISVFIKYDLQ
jgi:hypothetical protein